MTITAEEIGKFPVSTFRSCDTRYVYGNFTLETYLKDVCGDSNLVPLINELRSLEYKSEEYNEKKRHIPCATISCMCSTYRKRDDVAVRNRVICLDIDFSDNPDTMDTPEKRIRLRDALFTWSCCYAAGTSCSGRGIYLIVALESNEDQDEFEAYFRALEDDFAKNGIVIDKACKDVTRLRIASSDEVLIKTGDVECWSKKLDPPEPEIIHHRQVHDEYTCGITKETLLNEVIEMLIESGFSTDDYNSWLNLGFALQPLGYDGLSFYDRISQQSAEYQGFSKVREKFGQCRNSRYSFDDTCRYFFGKAKYHLNPGYLDTAQTRIISRIKNNKKKK